MVERSATALRGATTFVWNEFRRESRQVDAEGHERIFEFDPYGNPIAITDEAGAKHQYTYYEAAGQTHLRKSRIAPNGLVTQYAYDANGNLTDVTALSGRTVQYRDYTAFGQAQRIKNADGDWTLRIFDAGGNLTEEIRTRAGVTPVAGTKPATGDIVAWTQTQADSAGNPTRIRRLRDWSSASLGNPSSGVGPSLDYTYDTNKLNLTSTTRRGDIDGTPAAVDRGFEVRSVAARRRALRLGCHLVLFGVSVEPRRLMLICPSARRQPRGARRCAD